MRFSRASSRVSSFGSSSSNTSSSIRTSRRSSSGSDHGYVRPYQVATAAAIVVIAAVAMFDSRAAFSPSAGTQSGDVGARWYPFWAATIMGIASVIVGYRALTTPQGAEGAFEGSRRLFAVLKLAVPMLAYALLIGGVKWRTTDFTYAVIPRFGFYLSNALYRL